MINTMIPYKIQDGYGRDRKDKEWNAIILENEFLKAVFLPELGGRLWSIYDKVGNRELLYKNTVYQPGNLALRNAWFRGGVEFNMCIKSHNPLTCDKLFAEIATTPEGEVINLYEYERIRGVVYTISALWKRELTHLFSTKSGIRAKTALSFPNIQAIRYAELLKNVTREA